MDESGFTDDPSRKQVIVRRSTKHPISPHGGSGKSHTTVLMCTSASGEYDPKFLFTLNLRLVVADVCPNIWYIVVFICTTFGVPRMDSLAQGITSHQHVGWKNPYFSIGFLVNF